MADNELHLGGDMLEMVDGAHLAGARPALINIDIPIDRVRY